mmetsp:Transcript_13709/g.23532  ORF Transcript_13709/g.23532 Transcript_13709/m.23532 type:complete len:225 (+) Transcript_13709:418-1092(+)
MRQSTPREPSQPSCPPFPLTSPAWLRWRTGPAQATRAARDSSSPSTRRPGRTTNLVRSGWWSMGWTCSGALGQCAHRAARISLFSQSPSPIAASYERASLTAPTRAIRVLLHPRVAYDTLHACRKLGGSRCRHTSSILNARSGADRWIRLGHVLQCCAGMGSDLWCFTCRAAALLSTVHFLLSSNQHKIAPCIAGRFFAGKAKHQTIAVVGDFCATTSHTRAPR